MNVLKPHLEITVVTLLGNGVGQREICRKTGIDRKTVRRIQRRLAAKSPTPATGSGGDGCDESGRRRRESGPFGVRGPPAVDRGAAAA